MNASSISLACDAWPGAASLCTSGVSTHKGPAQHACWSRENVCPSSTRKVDIWLPGKGNSNSHGARPVYQNHPGDEVDSDQ